MYTGSIAELNCRLQSLEKELEQKQNIFNCLQAKYDAERVCTTPIVFELSRVFRGWISLSSCIFQFLKKLFETAMLEKALHDSTDI